MQPDFDPDEFSHHVTTVAGYLFARSDGQYSKPEHVAQVELCRDLGLAAVLLGKQVEFHDNAKVWELDIGAGRVLTYGYAYQPKRDRLEQYIEVPLEGGDHTRALRDVYECTPREGPVNSEYLGWSCAQETAKTLHQQFWTGPVGDALRQKAQRLRAQLG